MSIFMAAGLLAALSPVEPILSLDHSATIEHDGASIAVQYRTHVSLSQRQTGTPGKPGGASTLRCDWRADINVQREARHQSGTLLSRSIVQNGAVTVSRPGWCSKDNSAVAREIAARETELRAAAMQLAQSDEADLRAEVARLGSAG